jgi:hypothetical protein
VRLFLTSFDRFEKPMRNKNSCTWVTSYNFLCLLNLAESVDKFGPCRRWFEGKWLGERFVSEVKDERARCPPRNVHHYLMKKLHCSKAIDEIVRDTSTKQKEELLALNTRVYNTEEELRDWYINRHPMPVVVLRGGSLAALFYEKGRSVGKLILARRFTRLSLEPEESMHYGLKYWHFKLSDDNERVDYSDIIDFAVLLQKIGVNQHGIYTVITKNWSPEMFGEYDFADESRDCVAESSEDTLGEDWF